ncbi:hypothetical protein QYF36_019943 [Acer negundo]|nr:hypothetical protein QYF36_019943 [Acer negundo]
MGSYFTLCWKSEKSKRKPKTRSVHTQTDNVVCSPQHSPSPPSYPPPPPPTSRDKGKGIVIEEGKKRDKGKGIVTENGKKRNKGKGIVIDDGKKRHSSDSESDFDRRFKRSGTSRNYIPQHASDVENPPPPSDPPSGYNSTDYNTPYASNVENPLPPSNPPSEYYFPTPNHYYPPSYYSHLNYHPDKAEIPEKDKLAHNIVNSIFGNPWN